MSQQKLLETTTFWQSFSESKIVNLPRVDPKGGGWVWGEKTYNKNEGFSGRLEIISPQCNYTGTQNGNKVGLQTFWKNVPNLNSATIAGCLKENLPVESGHLSGLVTGTTSPSFTTGRWTKINRPNRNGASTISGPSASSMSESSDRSWSASMWTFFGGFLVMGNPRLQDFRKPRNCSTKATKKGNNHGITRYIQLMIRKNSYAHSG